MKNKIYRTVACSDRLPNGTGTGDYTVVFEDGTTSSDTDVYSDGVIGWLEEIDLPTEEAIRQLANELSQDDVYTTEQEIEAYVDGASFILNHIKGGG